MGDGGGDPAFWDHPLVGRSAFCEKPHDRANIPQGHVLHRMHADALPGAGSVPIRQHHDGSAPAGIHPPRRCTGIFLALPGRESAWFDIAVALLDKVDETALPVAQFLSPAAATHSFVLEASLGVALIHGQKWVPIASIADFLQNCRRNHPVDRLFALT